MGSDGKKGGNLGERVCGDKPTDVNDASFMALYSITDTPVN